MMSHLISIGFNNCLQCGSFAFRQSMLCRVCENNLFNSAYKPDLFESEVNQIPCMTLFRWQQDRNRILNRLSLGLKGTGQKAAWCYYASCVVQNWLARETPPQNSVIVPCPAVSDRHDHAYLFAEALSQLTGIPLIMALEKTVEGPQKNLTRRERVFRSGYQFRLRNNICEKFSRVYFVDDIITTGATVSAANTHLRALGRVKAISLIIRR